MSQNKEMLMKYELETKCLFFSFKTLDVIVNV